MATTEIAQRPERDRVTATIGARRGTYPDAPASRARVAVDVDG